MKIAILGFRGIPANYGGFETFVEELAPRLVSHGHEVTVYCRSNNIEYEGREYKGVNLVVLPTLSHKYFDTVVHTLISSIHSMFCRYDVVLMLNAANSPFAILPRMTGKKVFLNVDGIERLRKKWNKLGQIYYRIGEFFATKFPDAIVSDADVIKEYYLKEYNKDSVMIAYGAETEKAVTDKALKMHGLTKDEYILYVSRLEPENNAHRVIEAFKKIRTDKKLVIVGGAPYSSDYIENLHKEAESDERIIFTGFVYGDGYKELQSNSYCYIQATEVGGTHPALIEAMGFGNCVFANGTEENIEVLGDCGIIYKKNNSEDLAIKLQDIIDNPSKRDIYIQRAVNRIKRDYSWDSVVKKYESLFFEYV